MDIRILKGTRRLMCCGPVLFLTVALCSSLTGEEKPVDREKVGEVFGKPVYRDQIRSKQAENLPGELVRIFAGPAGRAYREKHRKEIDPTEEELEFAGQYFDEEHLRRIEPMKSELEQKLKAAQQRLGQDPLPAQERKKLELDVAVIEQQLKPPGLMFARFMLDNWKFQKHLYETYGGGRILWQQAGLEAFDANRMWLESMEKAGDFRITDPALRMSFYHYWTTQNHGPFLTDDRQRIRKEFLEPGWVKPAEKKAEE